MVTVCVSRMRGLFMNEALPVPVTHNTVSRTPVHDVLLSAAASVFVRDARGPDVYCQQLSVFRLHLTELDDERMSDALIYKPQSETQNMSIYRAFQKYSDLFILSHFI